MLPPSKIYYYYSVNGKPVEIPQDNTSLDDTKQLLEVAKVEENFKPAKLNVKKTNYIKNIIRRDELFTDKYMEEMTCRPRPLPVELIGLQRAKTPWKFHESVFAPYNADTEKLLNGCFDFDW